MVKICFTNLEDLFESENVLKLVACLINIVQEPIGVLNHRYSIFLPKYDNIVIVRNPTLPIRVGDPSEKTKL